jgi:hypothetical protein
MDLSFKVAFMFFTKAVKKRAQPRPDDTVVHNQVQLGVFGHDSGNRVRIIQSSISPINIFKKIKLD